MPMPIKPRLIDPVELRRRYIDLEQPAKLIAADLGTTPEVVKRWLREDGLPVRGRGGRNEARAFTHRYEDRIRELHAKGLRCEHIAVELGLTYGATYSRARKMGLTFRSGFLPGEKQPPRKTGFKKPNLDSRGEKNANYRGAASRQAKYGYEFTEQLREAVRQRDGYACRRCGGSQSKTRVLDVHHRTFDKSRNHPDDLIALCRPCHMAVEREGISI